MFDFQMQDDDDLGGELLAARAHGVCLCVSSSVSNVEAVFNSSRDSSSIQIEHEMKSIDND